MPKVGIWRLGEESSAPTRLEFEIIPSEQMLENALAADISIIDPQLLVIGRQVDTPIHGVLDLLAIDPEGNLVVIELKKGKTPRDVVAQLLEYGSWVRNLGADEVSQIFNEYMKKHFPNMQLSFDDTFVQKFGTKTIPDINGKHRLIIVADEPDLRTESILRYLAEEYGVNINLAYFQYFKEESKQYLSRVWLTDPLEAAARSDAISDIEEWNGEYYISFGESSDRRWEDAKKYGFISAGGKGWYSDKLKNLVVGCRIWVNVPRTGFVGVGRVKQKPQSIREFQVMSDSGELQPITSILNYLPSVDKPDDELEYFVKVDWIHAVSTSEGVSERGFFGNQNIVAQPKSKKWSFTVDRLKSRWGIKE